MHTNTTVQNNLIKLFTNLANNHKDNPYAMEKLCETFRWKDVNGDRLCDGVYCGSSCPFHSKWGAEEVARLLENIK